MNKLLDFFRTDWLTMTRTDWTGMVIVVTLFALMSALYVWIFKPSNKADFEQYRDFVNDDESREVKHGQAR